MIARLHTGLSALLLAAGLVACADVIETPEALGPIAVQPRVVMDGSVELGARAQDRIVINEVLFHSPFVTLNAGDEVIRDITASDDRGALLFRYDIASTDGFGNVLGGPRFWQLDDDGDLVFAFRSLNLAEPSALEELEMSSGVELGHLVGHTAVVHGYMLMASSSSGYGRDPCDGDPDGNPASCSDSESDGDPDGTPADENDGDPDGNPAKNNDDGDTEADGDPDANPADGDPDGNPAKPKPGTKGDGDPDGNPAWDESSNAARSADKEYVGNFTLEDPRVARERVPFALVLNAPFDLRLPISDLPPLAVNEVLPIELHVALDELFSVERIEEISHEAETAQSTVVLEVSDTSAVGIQIHAHGVKRAAESVGTGGIRVTGR